MFILIVARSDASSMRPHALLVIPLAAVAVLAFLAFGGDPDEPDAAAAQETALHWTEAEFADAPRRDGRAVESLEDAQPDAVDRHRARCSPGAVNGP